jgi:hexosaminidase
LNVSGTKSRSYLRLACIVLLVVGGLPTRGALLFAQQLSVIPAPLVEVETAGILQVKNGGIISYPQGDVSAEFDADHLVNLLQRTRGIKLVAKPAGRSIGAPILIALEREPLQGAAEEEGYDLDVSTQQVTISATSNAGLFYGTVTLWQMLTGTGVKSGPAELRCMHIHDAPQLKWRGIMLDSARHMQSIAYIRQLIEWMALEKLNVLHWHLTDDQGWRLEIKQYPKLTSVGGFRQLPGQAGMINPKTQKPYALYGGYYSQAEVRELVAYAAKRSVMIVPEIEMPGHASAALAAYPAFGSSSVRLKSPPSDYGIFPNLYNVNDSTFTFLENVLTEVMQLFPSPYIHIGGDEAIKNQWKASPIIQAKMKQLGVANEDELQSYFVKRIDSFLTAHHRRTLGWDEILEGRPAPNATVMSWHGVKGGIEAAKQGYDTVLTPARPLYFNYRQSDAADEAPGRFALNTLEDVYNFDPAPSTLTPDERKRILGVQANVWTEYLVTSDRDTWMIFPRSAALAEIGWSVLSKRNWNDFEARLVAQMHRYQALGIRFDPNAFRATSHETLHLEQGNLTVELSNQASFGTIRYTTDGLPVQPSSTTYNGPLTLPIPTHLRAAVFLNDEIPDSELDRKLDAVTASRRYSQEMKLCSDNPAEAMEQDPPTDGKPVMLVNYKNPCWIYKAAALTGERGIRVGVATLPYVFQDRDNRIPSLGDSHTPFGELEVHLDSCGGALLAALPFESASGRKGISPLFANIPKLEGVHDLCFVVVRPHMNPLWALDWVQLEPLPR